MLTIKPGIGSRFFQYRVTPQRKPYYFCCKTAIMGRIRIILLGLFFGLCWYACLPPENRIPANQIINLDLSDQDVQHLYNLRDQRRTDSLVRYLSDPRATMRYLAALSFSSVRDSNAVEPLVTLLQDTLEEVRTAAAFALGQIGSPRAEEPLLNAFRQDDSLSQHQQFNAMVLEAIGKCGGLPNLINIAAVSTYLPSDTLLLEGQCRAIYRYALRDITDDTGTALMVRYAANEDIPESARLMAAHYLARAKDVSADSTQAVQLAAAFVRSADPKIRMALARALGKSNTKPAFAILSKVINTEQDWRVKCDLIKAMGNYQPDTVRALVTPFVQDINPHVSFTAAAFFVANGRREDGDYYWRIARENPDLPWATRISLYRASYKWLSGRTSPEKKEYLNYKLRDFFLKSDNPHERAACLSALTEYAWQYRWIRDKGMRDSSQVVRTAAVEALVTICQRPDFYRVFGENGRRVRRDLYSYLKDVVETGDPGMIAAASAGFCAEALNYELLADTSDINMLNRALRKLQIPRDYETQVSLQKAIACLSGEEEPEAAKPRYNHPIDWGLLKNVDQTTRVVIHTASGKISLRLFPVWAPGSVANFIDLAKQGFYNGKTFHRVVPNFVVQSGFPRGDGYGIRNHTIRTEIGMNWYEDEGYVGMASLGSDTESTQFFITHSPTPHLDGRYTIFGKVTQGIDVVHKLQVGDVIEKVVVE